MTGGPVMGERGHALVAALRTVAVSPDCRGATIGQRTISASGPDSLRPGLSAAIYDELHAGWTRPEIRPGADLRDQGIEDAFRRLMPNQDVIRTEPVLDNRPGHVLVRLNGVRVWVPRDRAERSDAAEARIRLPADRPALSAGYFLADSGDSWILSGSVLRLYVHLTSMTAAYDAWAAVHRVLDGLETGYRVKVASWPAMLPRRDALVVYLAARQRDMTQRLVTALRDLRGVGPETSVFARALAPGVAVAWEPADPRPGMSGLSFGEHSAGVLAEALIRHATSQSAGHDLSLTTVLKDAFTEAGIDPDDPSRNL